MHTNGEPVDEMIEGLSRREEILIMHISGQQLLFMPAASYRYHFPSFSQPRRQRRALSFRHSVILLRLYATPRLRHLPPCFLRHSFDLP